ncbi:MAG: recombinase family protein [Planctomycetota bacterium]
MLRRRTFNRMAANRYMLYGRVSTDMQNPRSNEQQFQTARETIKRNNLPWIEVNAYSDFAVSGQLTSRRPGLQKLIGDLESGRIECDVILVDTMERLSRTDDIYQLRAYFAKLGIVIVTAESELRDPTTSDGELISMIDSWRGNRENVVKSHMVRRGKRDAVRQKRWPGGPVPIGYRLEPCGTEKRGSRIVEHHRLVPDDATRFLPERCYQLADERGWGGGRIAAELNSDQQIPDYMKPIHPATVSRILQNPIYVGRFEWGRQAVGYVDDIRVVDTTPTDEWLIVDDFCEPLIARAQAERVAALQRQRKTTCDSDKKKRKKPGVAVKYPLSGLVVCSECGRSMVAATRGTTEAERARHAIYRCPHVTSGICTNRAAVPEPWLRGEVMSIILQRLFVSGSGAPTQISPEAVSQSPVFQDFLHLVETELKRFEEAQPSETAATEAEQGQLSKQKAGITKSLMNPDLDSELRRHLEQEFVRINTRLTEIEACQRSKQQRQGEFEPLCRPARVAQELNRIAAILTSQNAPSANIELSRIVDFIEVDLAGKIRIRIANFAFLLPPDLLYSNVIPLSAVQVEEPRFLATRGSRIRPACSEKSPSPLHQDTAIRVDRFDGFDPQWFCTFELQTPKKLSWPEEHAIEVAESRLAEPCTLEKLAARFHVSKPTVVTALKIAEVAGVDAMQIDGRQLQPNWAEDNAIEVAKFLRQSGVTMADAVRHFGKSDAWIRRAKKNAIDQECR